MVLTARLEIDSPPVRERGEESSVTPGEKLVSVLSTGPVSLGRLGWMSGQAEETQAGLVLEEGAPANSICHKHWLKNCS